MNGLRLRLPATSANLGPGFDTLALALEIFLQIDAQPSSEFTLDARGRNPEICGSLQNNLLIETYRQTLAGNHREVIPLSILMENAIPLGMGCGSSASVRVAGVALAAHFGMLGWDGDQIMQEAARLEGHPDNVAACWHGGLTIAAGKEEITVVSIPPPRDWRAILVLPDKPVATSKSRSVVPQSYSRADAVVNVQNVAMLTAAFALNRPDLLASATQDRMHRPYRMELCPLLPALLPLAGHCGVASVTLSGAGPSVLLLGRGNFAGVREEINRATSGLGQVEIVQTNLWVEGTKVTSIVGPT
jgi:homoserine kinase